jgi:hypothetical protein
LLYERVYISIENISRPFTNAAGVQPLTGNVIKLRAESPIINSIGQRPMAISPFLKVASSMYSSFRDVK